MPQNNDYLANITSMKYKLVLLAAVFLTACSNLHKPIPEGYRGPVVMLADTSQQDDDNRGKFVVPSKAQFFAAIQIDGRDIENSLFETRRASQDQGFNLTVRTTIRDVPVTPMKVKLIGTHQTAAPIHEIASRVAGTFFSVEGVVDFNPAEGRRYYVTGELGKDRSCVWIAEMTDRQAVTEKVCTH